MMSSTSWVHLTGQSLTGGVAERVVDEALVVEDAERVCAQVLVCIELIQSRSTVIILIRSLLRDRQ